MNVVLFFICGGIFYTVLAINRTNDHLYIAQNCKHQQFLQNSQCSANILIFTCIFIFYIFSFDCTDNSISIFFSN